MPAVVMETSRLTMSTMSGQSQTVLGQPLRMATGRNISLCCTCLN